MITDKRYVIYNGVRENNNSQVLGICGCFNFI